MSLDTFASRSPASQRLAVVGPILGALLVMAVAIGSMVRLTRFDFTNWDDDHTVAANPELLPPTAGSLLRLWADPRADIYIPVTYTVWWALSKACVFRDADGEFALDPQVFHSANLIVHALAGLGAFVLLRRLTRSDLAACAAALIFAAHPVQVEPVAWISGLKDVLFGLLSIIAMWQYVRYATASEKAFRQDLAATDLPASDWRRSAHWLLTLAFYVLAMLAKPTAAVLPLMLMAIDKLILGRSIKLVLRGTLPLAALAIPILLYTRVNQPAPMNTTIVAIWLRPLVAGDALAFYLFKLIWPANLTVDYGRHPKYVVESGAVWFMWIIPALLTIILYLLRRRRPALLAGAIIFVAALLPVLGLVRFDFQEYSTAADHYLYLPMLGVALIVADCVSRHRLIGSIAIGVLVVLLGMRSFDQTRYWRNSETLFRHQIEQTPRSLLGYINIVDPLLKQKRFAEGESVTRHAIELRPDSDSAQVNLGLVFLMTNRPTEAIECFERAIKIRPRSIDAHVNLAYVYGQVGRIDESIEQYRKVLELDPKNRIATRMLPKAIAWQKRLQTVSTRPARQGTGSPTQPTTGP